MQALGKMILSVSACTMLCGIISVVLPSETGRKMLRMIGGLLIVTMLFDQSTAIRIEVPDLLNGLLAKGIDSAQNGQKYARDTQADIITSHTSAYIMDKAKELGVYVTAEITADGEEFPIPVAVALEGSVSQFARLQIEAMIENDLGIQKENIRWME